MKLSKTRPKTELQEIKDSCKSAGFDYDLINVDSEVDTAGNIIFIVTSDTKLQDILKSKGFIT